ncbi:MAG: ABC transporter substrate-binding protein [Flavobacteriaceae bacterium]|nr:ABC transporter substrate-binding protein [Flavobacteriaceae bacterium]
MPGIKFKCCNYLGFAISLLLIFVSCKRVSSNYDDSHVFRYNEHSNISSLDPAFAKKQADIWAVNQLYNGLVQLDDSLNIQPDIAKNWKVSDDGKTYFFTLRNDVKFHKHPLFGKDSTRYVTANDFEYSLNRLLDENVASPGGWVLENVSGFQAQNDTTFVINLKQPFPPFLGLLSMKYCSVVPREIVEYYGNEFRSNPIGTGPFQFKIWVENTKLVYRKNPNYHEKDKGGDRLPYLEAVAITFLPDKQSEFLQLVQGNIDFLSGLDASYKDDALTTDGRLKERYKDQLSLIMGAYLNTEYLGLLMDVDSDYPTSNHLLRKAINYGFDREKMMLYMRNGIGTPAVNGFIPKGLPSFRAIEGYEYNSAKAKVLIDQFKKQTGNQNPEITITTNSQYLDLCEYIQRELQKIGLQVKVDVIPPSTLRQSKATGKLPVFRASWIADYPDAENYLSLFYSKNFAPNGPNYTHFKNQRFDELYEEAFVTVDNSYRYALYQQMDSIIIAEAPVVPLYYDAVVRFSQKNVKGLGINPINLLNLKYVSKKKPLP